LDDERSKQPSGQQVSLARHGVPLQPHCPLVQVSPRLHDTVQPPQYISLVMGSAQVSLQQICPGPQVMAPHAHWPATQLEPAPHAWPQAPQFCGSLVRLRQPVEQHWSPAAHTAP
jgi:hypothetical protein